MKQKRKAGGWLAALILVACSSACVADKYPQRMLMGDKMTGQIKVVEKDGSISWSTPAPGMSMDGQMLPNGNVLFCYFNKKGPDKCAGVREVTPQGETVFEYTIEKECHAVQRLANGNTLIDDPQNRQLIEVNPAGDVVFKLPLTLDNKSVHRSTRISRKLDNGNYLVVHEGDETIREYKADGTIVWDYKVGGHAYYAERLPNGNTLIAAGNEHAAYEVTPAGEKVWEFTADDFPEGTNLEWIVGAYRLENGNTQIVNWLGHKKGGKGITMLEVTPSKEIVWIFDEPGTANYVRMLN